MAISVVFTTGSRIFAQNKQQLNAPPEPLDCKTLLLESGATCDSDNSPSLSASRYNPKTRKCECYSTKENDPKLQTCQEKIKIMFDQTISQFWEVGDTCCCECKLDASYCTDRGWAFIDTYEGEDASPLSCKCDCENRVESGVYYLSYDDCPIAPLIGYPEDIAGKKLWNPFTCECDCEKLTWFKDCEDPFVKGPGCSCICNPDNVPEECDQKMDGSIGIFDEFESCSCIYPCPPGSTPYYCNSKSNSPPTKNEHVLKCAKCDEGEYLGGCIFDNVGSTPERHCCPYGKIWKSDARGCVDCVEENAPQCERGFSQLNTKICQCCPENYLYDDYSEECILSCETIYSPDQNQNIPQSECVSPRSITDDCECVCPPETVWINDTCVPYDNICPLPSDHPDYNPKKTVWDPIEEECVCEEEDCESNLYLDPSDCLCKCGGDFILSELGDCVCPSGTALSRYWSDSLTPNCQSCGDIHGYLLGTNQPLAVWIDYNTCDCIEGYIFEKLTNDQILEDIDPKCVTCEEYTENGATMPNGDCGCAPGFIQESDGGFSGNYSCIPEPTPTPTPTSEPETPTPSPETPAP